MGAASAWSVALSGIDGTPVKITVHVGPPHPVAASPHGINGLGEMRDRVAAAIRNSGLLWPIDQVTIGITRPQPHVAPFSDLAVAAAVLAAHGEVSIDEAARMVFLGELALDGRIRPVRGVLPALLAARDAGYETAIVPTIMLPEAQLVIGMRVLGADRLSDVVAWLRNNANHLSTPSQHRTRAEDSGDADVQAAKPDLADIVEQAEATRALEVAAAGGHHLLIVGEPGAGAPLCAQALPGLLPTLTDEQALETTAVHSLAGALASEFPLVRRPPFVAPHHSCSVPALLGSVGGVPKPGAMSLAHHGVLFLDEAAEFATDRLEALRTALEEREIRLAHRAGVARYPARFQLVLATRPCPCGQAEQQCTCSKHAQRRFLARLAGPLLDCVDLRVRLRPPSARARSTSTPDESAIVRGRVHQARLHAAERWAPQQGRTNADVPGAVFTDDEFRLPRRATAPLDRALETGSISGRGGVRTLRVAWTLADLAGLTRPGRDQVAEALEFRDRRTTSPAD